MVEGGPVNLLERKRAQIRTNSGSQLGKNESGDLFDRAESNEESSQEEVDPAVESKVLKRSKKSQTATSRDLPKEKRLRIEGLKYKVGSKGSFQLNQTNHLPQHLAIGSLILGQITHVRRHELTVALPNNLTGHVPLTSISEQLNEKLRQILEGDEEEQGITIV